MPDVPDYSKYLPGSIRYSVQDIGEFAARLKSPVTFDRRGEVLWFDTGAFGLSPWAVSTGGTGSAVDVVTSYTHHGPYALRLTGGLDASWTAQIIKRFALIDVARCGIEVAFYLETLCSSFWIAINRLDGVNAHRGKILVDPQNGELTYENDGGSTSHIAAINAGADPFGIWQHLKLVVDFDKGEYVRCLLNDVEYPLAGVKLYEPASAEAPQDRVTINLLSRDTFNDLGFIGHVIVTGNEP